ncbi:leucyl aminopeptidase [Lentisphaera profundi]|uniref:Probable cytosol aminopeptidase n=1 Tax=Lentisphaera profundi TaxID=1658616 RepID=A0ABY7W3A9_9BACT|nr:leucyl aminopeptidase [Lentisphaera profundi]WDE98758.1 leucyl aminopeptidase [Lentisphaera profundi]
MDIHFITNCEIEPEVDCLIIPAWEGELDGAINSSLIALEDQTSLNLIHERGNICGKDMFYLPTPMSAYRGILILGLGKKEGDLSHKFRSATGKAVSLLQKYKKHHLLLELGHVPELQTRHFVAALNLGQYEYDAFKTKKSETVKVDNLCVHLCASKDITIEQGKANRAQIFTECANYARDLGNAPGNALTPKILADKARNLAKETDSEIEVLGEAEMGKLGMGALLSVSAGSDEEAQLIILKHTHPSATKTVAIVGKGVTFDSGGISLKPGKGMQEMKYDMCGAAAVLGAFKAICECNAAINVICVVPSSENLINGKATKPGDIVTAYNGKTIEIYNTDAEGRLLLCDAMAYTAETYKPDIMIDVATLTGACIVALGHEMSAIISEDDELQKDLIEAGSQVHERLWPLPLNDDYKKLLHGTDADLCNIGPPYAGTITAAGFLSNFAGDTRWAHLDIAGTAWGMKGCTYINEKLASGFGTRLLAKWLMNIAE